ncbi:MAG TPA: pyruvate dehydrogenase complex dihydrolipoamide acetyltransferase [Acetobacteraceae bacterium]|nr:pyruvate dehydrogenase complex dihydrolipoamide acetyltransferase [Acetobacteraceae bacterium]
MATNILMPALSPTMTEGTLARWLKKEGEPIRAGDVIAEIETDKATMEVEAVDEGVLGKILVGDGTEGVKVNQPIAVLVEQGESVPADAGGSAEPGAKQAPPTAKPAAKTAEPPAQVAPNRPGEPPAPRPAEPAPQPQPSARSGNGHDAGGERIFVSPLARRMALQAGIDLRSLKGSGPNGRIVKLDIEAAQRRGVAPPAAAGTAAAAAPQAAPALAAAPPAAQLPMPITAPHRAVQNSTMRKVIARRLTQAHQVVPFFFVSMDIEIDALLKLREELNAKSPKDGPSAFRLSVNDLVIKAAALTLRRVPQLNATFTEDATLYYEDVDISVAVSLPEGLITPIVRKADQKGLAAISNEMKELIARAKAGKLKPEEFQGGGFSISNMGMYGVSQFTAIINPPQSAILAVAAGQQRPVVKNGALAVATIMTCTLTVDHRVADGALGAQWMAAFKAIVEDPLSLML